MSSEKTDEERNIEMWRIKKLIKMLENAKGDGTSMISLIIPPKGKISDVSRKLAEEAGTASNIKSRVNKLSVLAAITSISERLKRYGNNIPENGLVLYCGTVLTTDNKEKRLCIDIEPFKPINTSLYMCDNKFHVGPLRDLLEDDSKFGFIIMDGSGTLFATLSGNTRTILYTFSVDLPKKHGRGGQSALRFARLRMEKRHNYLRKVAELSTQFFITNDRPNVSGLILAGLADFKKELAETDMFDQRLKRVIIGGTFDVSYGGENGLNQAIELASENLSEVKFIQEKKLLTKLMEQIAQDTGRYSVGLKETLFAMEANAVETIIVWEGLNITRYKFKNETTGEEKICFLTPEQCKQRSNFVQDNIELKIIENDPLLDWFADNYKKFGATLEFVTDKSELGNQFVKGFGGCAGLLRYSLECGLLAGLDDEVQADDDDDFI